MILKGTYLLGILCLGGILGLLYFGGLWTTLNYLPKARQPLVLFGWSYMIRLGAVLGIFHLLLQWIPQDQVFLPLLMSFLGFLWVRTWLITRLSLSKSFHKPARQS